MGKSTGKSATKFVTLQWLSIFLFVNYTHRNAEAATFDLDPVNFTLADAVKTDVTYKLFTRNVQGFYIDETNVQNFNINRDIPVKLFIHGWLSNETTYWYGQLKDKYLEKGEYAVIYIDWSKAGSKQFEISAANAKPIGEFIGDFIISSRVTLADVHVIGHSLGSHVAGFVGKQVFRRTGCKIGRITGTDPAGPSFEHRAVGSDSRIASTDALFVDIIHTDIGHYGFSAPIGHADFYPNGGTLQPGCPSYEEDDNCSHARSNLYFIESVTWDKFRAKKCLSWDDYKEGRCEDESITFGENVPNVAKGIYYFATRSASPFALG